MGRAVRISAKEMREALRKRHPATQPMGARRIPGPWTCVEEWARIDLLALCATRSGGRVPYARVGYEVKVSRSDYRSELREPNKRAFAVGACHEFYFAVPSGLLRDDELPGADQPQLRADADLYVPDDVGLVVVNGRGCQVVKSAPLTSDPAPIVGGPQGDGFGSDLNALIRWVSARPDPRHDGVVEAARNHMKEIREAEAGRRATLKRARERDRGLTSSSAGERRA